jgi:hypothetical protein
MRRFETLDGLRGLGACLIAAAHGSLFISSSLQGQRIVDGLSLLVDFFFVLSGFVIAAGFQGRLETGAGLVPFFITRLGRLYPLHLTTLALLVGLKAALAVFGADADVAMRVAAADEYDATSLFTNALLVHALGVEAQLTWNWPSWSISVELFAYGVFALLWATFGVFENSDRILLFGGAGIVVACLLILYWYAPAGLHSTYDFAFVRGLLGFTVGALTHRLYRAVGEEAAARIPRAWATVLETAAIAVCAWLVWLSYATKLIVLAPLALGGFLLLFAYERGLVSRALRWKPLIQLGAVSYSIYLLHFVVYIYEIAAVRLLSSVYGSPIDASTTAIWTGSKAVGDLLILANVIGVVGLSALTYRFIEAPGQALAKGWAKRWEARHLERAGSPRPARAASPSRGALAPDAARPR